MKSYVVRSQPPAYVCESLSAYPPLLQELLYSRGIDNPKEADIFLNPSYDDHVHDPYLMKDMDKAVERILKAIHNDEHVVIYSDYDADGIPGAVVLHDFFKKIGFKNFENYFPHRYDEGYGLNENAVLSFSKSKTTLLVTIDCGISDLVSVARANELGIDVVITDHHLSQEGKVPKAFAIVNPKQEECGYPCDMLCGSGVIYKLIQAILVKKNFGIKKGAEKWFLDMVGLATMADMVPLLGENRIFAHYGLRVLRKSPRLGLMKLLRYANVDQRFLNEDDVGFTIAPRINAASRMGIPREAFDLLTAVEDTKADRLSLYLQQINEERKGMSAFLVKEVRKIVESRKEKGEPTEIIVVGNPNWKPALLGPVANNILDAYGVPVFLWGRADGDVIKGSVRSDGVVNVLELMKHALPDTFIGYGGHKCSGGFSVSHTNIHQLEANLKEAYDKLPKIKISDSFLTVDRRLTLEEVTWDTYRIVEMMSPFGEGNPKPLFVFDNVAPSIVKMFGKEKNHLEITFTNTRNKVKAIRFFFKSKSENVVPEVGKRLSFVAAMEKSYFRNYPELRLRIVDIL